MDQDFEYNFNNCGLIKKYELGIDLAPFMIKEIEMLLKVKGVDGLAQMNSCVYREKKNALANEIPFIYIVAILTKYDQNLESGLN